METSRNEGPFPRRMKHGTDPSVGERGDTFSPSNSTNRQKWLLLRVETRRILLICSLILLPIITFIFITLWLVFHYRLSAAFCPFPQLCPQESKLNTTRTDFTAYYYVDYPAARLVFIASLSSSLSFTLIAALMATYSYTVARQLLRFSDKKDNNNCPTPYNMSMLYRILNAEVMALFEIITIELKETFWEIKEQRKEPRPARLVYRSIMVFVVGICASVFTQATDIYLHAATKAVEFVRIQSEPITSHTYSRGLELGCIDSPTQGSIENRNFWGCGMGPSSDGSGIGGANYAKFQELDLGLSKVNSIKNFTQDGDYTEILIPKSVEPSIDWQASSFGVSTQCRALRNDSCDVGADAGSNVFGNTSSFNCTKERAGVNIHGTVSALRHQVYFLDWHRVIKESPPFESYTHNVNESYVGTLATLAAELSDDDGGEVFSNPWSFIAAISFAKEALDFENDTDKVVWKLNGRPKSMLLCNATVWDVEYTVTHSRISSLKRSPSNSSTTGTANMPLVPMWGISTSLSQAADEANIAATNIPEFVNMYAQAVSRRFLASLSAQSSPRAALAVQSRSSRIISRVPKAAIWLLIAANSVFILFAVTLAVFAFIFVYSSEDVHQVHTRLSIAGLVAQIFEGEHAQRKVKDSYELFQEHANKEEKVVKRVMVERLAAGGTKLKVSS